MLKSMLKKINWLIITSSVLFLTQTVWADDYAYHGKVKGMVCAFCAYNVGDKIGNIVGVNAVSVQVDLKSGIIDFLSTATIKQLAPVLAAIGNMAAEKTSRLSIRAEKSHKIDLLKPIIAGRQRAIKIDFVTMNSPTIELSVYQVTTPPDH